MVELIHCSHRMVYTNQTICWDPIETERSEATIPRRSRGDAKCLTPAPGDSMITVTGGSKRPAGTVFVPLYCAVYIVHVQLYNCTCMFLYIFCRMSGFEPGHSEFVAVLFSFISHIFYLI